MTFAEGHIETYAGRLRYRESGAGYPVVVINGLPWRDPVVPETLAREYRVLEMTLPADAPAGDASPTAREMTDMASPVVSAMVDGGYTLIGTSFGASAALWLALRQPERVEALVLISPVGIEPAAGFSAEDDERLARRLFAHPEAAGLKQAPPDTEAAELERAALARLRSVSHDSELEAGLAGVRCPTLVVFGQEDRLISPAAARVYQERVLTCNVAWVYDAGHAIAAERPEALAGLVLDYVKRRETFIVEDRAGIINP